HRLVVDRVVPQHRVDNNSRRRLLHADNRGECAFDVAKRPSFDRVWAWRSDAESSLKGANPMKTSRTMTVWAASAMVAVLIGCSKPESPAPSSAVEAPKPSQKTAAEMHQQAEAPKAAMQPTSPGASAGVTDASVRAQGLINKAQ